MKTKRKKHLMTTTIISVLLWCLVATILFPALKTVQMSFTENESFSLIHYQHFFTTVSSLETFKNSILLGLLTVVICGFIGTLLAFSVHCFDIPYRRLIDKILLMPIMLPGLIIVFSFVQLYGESGIITQSLKLIFKLEDIPYQFSGLGGILFVHAYTQYVYFYLSVSIAIKHIDASVIEAARNLGASNWRIFRSMVLPFLKPALIGSSIITFMSGIGSFSAPSIIGGSYKVMTTQILLSKANNYMSVAAMQVVLLSAVSLFYLWMLKQYEKKIHFTSSVRFVPLKSIKIKNKVLKVLQLSIFTFTTLLIMTPVIMIIVLSFVKPGTWMIEIFPKSFSMDNYIRIFTHARSFQPFQNSIVMALLASVFCLVIAIPSSFIIVKTKSKFKWLIEFLVMLPWTMPASAIAINTINAYNTPTIFSFNKVMVGSFILLPIAYFVSSIPLMIRTTNVSLQNLNDTYIEASRSLGANWLNTFHKIIMPSISPGIVAGFLLVFIRSIGEYTVSVFLYTVSNKPVSIAMVNGIFEYEIGLAMTYGALIIVLSATLTITISKLLPQRM